jgi:hypothetical protein
MSPPTELALTPETLEQLAQRVAELVVDRSAVGPPLVDAEALARFLNVERSYVYEHAAELGGKIREEEGVNLSRRPAPAPAALIPRCSERG